MPTSGGSSESIPEPIPEQIPELAPESESALESESSWGSYFAPVTESEMIPDLELATEWESVLDLK